MPATQRRARLIRPEELPSEGMAGGATHKTIVSKGNDGTDVTVYYSLVKPGQTHDWHHHEEDEVIYVVQGEGRYDIEGGSIPYRKGQFIFMPKGTRHCNVCTGQEDVRLVAIFQPGRE
ncbi:MAG: cupin domain-containing protein [Candidatus Tectomicrobia bacterium]|uniref:Cupin domain-containing protein n=1 Tax=Tectimicrobiota bacterium TaxID=2528274 RepID=A0A932ZWG5_UNCTE|nr:cupin domain-containing protein [Candidatus Tectomicrobia bacterium]MBI2177641.1 cupin domain-containing protein [Candidatus Tectomicrobia bacterium]MBI4251810.1 cupin domain-containing protein [Candidatus Tectomicrobia bacterium]